VKGIDVLQAVKSLRAMTARPALGPAAATLVKQRILPSSWYPMEPFREVLGTLHRVRFGGTDESALEMGRDGARTTLSGEQAAYVSHGEPKRTLQAFERIWRSHYDFGRVETAQTEEEARFLLHGYADVPRWHGLIIIGWFLGALEMSGARHSRHQLESAPWTDAEAPLKALLSWGGN
jgi:uncharacterized protein (TIGR02265 family)